MGSRIQRTIGLAFSLLLTFLLTYQIVFCLSALKTTASPEIYLIRIALALAGFCFPITSAWMSFQFLGGIIFSLYAAMLVLFAGVVLASPIFVWFMLLYIGLGYLLFRLDQDYENRIAAHSVDMEQFQNEKNDLEVAYKVKGEGISILFEKYSTYYNLRKLAEELATTLAVSELSRIIVERCYNFIPRGDVSLIALANTEGQALSLVAYKQMRSYPSSKIYSTTFKGGDLFDFWIVKNRRRLIVNDTQQDFRFDIKETAQLELIRSLVAAPLLYEGRIMGTLRINASKPNVFTNDDLRLLDTIAALASSALSNAMLYEQTEELAIRDSLTGLYVRRYFYDRLKEEHRRALLTQRPLSLLMCDLDHFKASNDRYGHAAGDLMLTAFAETLRQHCEHAIVARYGGEEFSVLLPETSREDAFEIADRIRKAVEANPFLLRREKIAMTVSIGVANLPQDTLDLEELVRKADQALYQAKREGRNKVCLSGS